MIRDKRRLVSTVEINIDGSKVIINKSDFDSKKHTLWDNEEPVKPGNSKEDVGLSGNNDTKLKHKRRLKKK